MSRFNPKRSITPLLSAAEVWIQRSLIGEQSLFTEKPLWALNQLEEVRAAFTDNPDAGDASFIEKLQGQMGAASAEAKCLMAELLWVLMLFQSNIGPSKKRESIGRVWGWSGSDLDMSNPLLSDEVLMGVGSPGTAYNTMRWRELNYLIGLAIDLATRSREERQLILLDRDRFEAWIEHAPQEGYRQFRHLFRYLAFPDQNERITLGRDRRMILEAFTDLDAREIVEMSDAQQDDQLNVLREELKARVSRADLDFYEPDIAASWRICKVSRDTPSPEATDSFELGYAALRERFLSQLPGFENFSSHDRYAGERAYKDELRALFRASVSQALADGNLRAAGESASMLLTVPLKAESNKPQNIVGWRYVDLLRKPTTEQQLRIGGALAQLTDEERPLEQRVDQFVNELPNLTNSKAKILPAAQRSIAGFFLALSDPQRHIFLKTQETQRALRQLDPTFQWNALRLTGADVVRVESLANRLFTKLTAEGWAPRDLLDVQGFLWVAVTYDSPRIEDEAEDDETEEMSVMDPEWQMSKQVLNRILFGPPGTGKTYATIDHALSILDPGYLHSNGAGGRAPLKARFDELVAQQRIRFVTFHQSFSYEDFVEGLRADTDESGNLRYRVEPGVFKQICDDARGAAQVASQVGIREGARIWKISIDGTSTSATREHGFRHGEARVGWGEVGDLDDEHLTESVAYQALGSNDRNTLKAFSSEIQPGDILLCISTTSEIQAIGVVQGDYRYDSKIPTGVRSDFNNVLPVNWLATGLTLNLRRLNGGIRFTLKTVYELTRFSWAELAQVISEAGIHLEGARTNAVLRPLDHVLIVDEINRGNVSRIFGELITLIEDSKRAGNPEQLEVVLPYSKKSFRVPGNVYLIGTMNTADRSLAGLDIALRRRFNFVEIAPDPKLLTGIAVSGVDISLMLERMNDRIELLLGRDHKLGHAYFMPLREDPSLESLAAIFRNQILPLLQEYFFEDWQRIAWVLNDHRKSKGFQFVVSNESNADELFGKAAEVPAGAKLWHVDNAAFTQPDSYRGILGDR